MLPAASVEPSSQFGPHPRIRSARLAAMTGTLSFAPPALFAENLDLPATLPGPPPESAKAGWPRASLFHIFDDKRRGSESKCPWRESFPRSKAAALLRRRLDAGKCASAET